MSVKQDELGGRLCFCKFDGLIIPLCSLLFSEKYKSATYVNCKCDRTKFNFVAKKSVPRDV